MYNIKENLRSFLNMLSRIGCILLLASSPNHGFRSMLRNKYCHNIFRLLSMRTKNGLNKSVTRTIAVEHNTIIPKVKNMAPIYSPKTPNQKLYVDHLEDSTCPILFGIGPAGTGKTMFACSTAIHALKLGNVNKIILTRPIVPVEDEELGFLPGDIKDKMDPWTRPMFDIFLEYYPQVDIDFMVRNKIIEISPLAYMRGRTFKNAFIIADEMQNSTPNQMLMLTTRIGMGSKMVITGDLAQSDRKTTNSKENGLFFFMNKIKTYYSNHNKNEAQEVRVVELSNLDIERSPVVSKILDIYAGNPH